MIDIPALEQTLEVELRHCRPCGHGAKKMTVDLIAKLRGLLPDGWRVVNDTRLKKKFTFTDYELFVGFIADVCDETKRRRHPACIDACGVALTVELTLYTHRIDGLTAHDWIAAAVCDNIYTGG